MENMKHSARMAVILGVATGLTVMRSLPNAPPLRRVEYEFRQSKEDAEREAKAQAKRAKRNARNLRNQKAKK